MTFAGTFSGALACSLAACTVMSFGASAAADTVDELVAISPTIAGYRVDAMVPDGYVLELLSGALEQPRVLHFAGERLFVGSRSGKVYWLDPPYTDPHILVDLPGYPHSVVVQAGRLYVARTDSVSSAPYKSATTVLQPGDFAPLVDLPGGRGHNSRTLKIGPDDRLYVSLGLSGNCSNEYLDQSYPFAARRGGIFVIEQSDGGAQLVPFGAGLRNPVGFDWHPDTDELYASNNGPDHLGYEAPREYFARVTEGSFHGMPWFRLDGESLVRDACIDSEPPRSLAATRGPVATFPARIAPMDVAFVTDAAEARDFRGDALVALHGSWATADGSGSGDPGSRRAPGIVRVAFTDGKAGEVHDVVTGFQRRDGARWARPMGIAIGPDGAIYFSSDDGVQGLYRLRLRR